MNLDVHLYIHNGSDATKLDQILTLLNAMNLQEKKIMADLSALEAEVTNNTTVEQSAITLLQGLKSQLDAAGTDAVKLKALSDQLGANDTALAAAVAANTPAAPPATT